MLPLLQIHILHSMAYIFPSYPRTFLYLFYILDDRIHIKPHILKSLYYTLQFLFRRSFLGNAIINFTMDSNTHVSQYICEAHGDRHTCVGCATLGTSPSSAPSIIDKLKLFDFLWKNFWQIIAHFLFIICQNIVIFMGSGRL